MVLDAIEMARWSRGRHHAHLRYHNGAGSQFTSIRYGGRLAEIGATPSIGTIGDSYDARRDRQRLLQDRTRPWKSIEDLELATLGWKHWHNAERMHGDLGDVPPVEFENAFSAGQGHHAMLVGIK